ncbi:MAG: hypothetical protein LBN04_04160 [Oscillospiraceae bacterium]|jgi:hypothetical protein|nr:hypothetical protein [Oscillospiraceae bacterium]
MIIDMHGTVLDIDIEATRAFYLTQPTRAEEEPHYAYAENYMRSIAQCENSEPIRTWRSWGVDPYRVAEATYNYLRQGGRIGYDCFVIVAGEVLRDPYPKNALRRDFEYGGLSIRVEEGLSYPVVSPPEKALLLGCFLYLPWVLPGEPDL